MTTDPSTLLEALRVSSAATVGPVVRARGEVAIGTTRATERDVNVDSGVLHREERIITRALPMSLAAEARQPPARM